MKLIVDIPDKVYNECREGVMSMENNCIIGNAVFDGIPYEERPQGEWQPDMDSFYCDQCGVTALEINRKWYKSNFCPNCGADMRKGGKNNG